jgi:hypothetical protein
VKWKRQSLPPLGVTIKKDSARTVELVGALLRTSVADLRFGQRHGWGISETEVGYLPERYPLLLKLTEIEHAQLKYKTLDYQGV